MSLADEPRISNTDHLSELKTISRWIIWKPIPKRNGAGYRKVAVNPKSKPRKFKAHDKNDPLIHMSYKKAINLSHKIRIIKGVGFVPTKGDPYTFLDFDDVVDRDTGEVLKPWVLDLVRRLGSYTEWSPSGTGLRTIVRGTMSTSGGKHSLDGREFEVYDYNQFLTITENVYLDAPIQEAQGFIDSLSPVIQPTNTRASEIREVELPEDKESVLKKVKRVLVKNDLSPEPIQEPGRKLTLLSVCGKVWKSGQYTKEEFWTFLNEVNSTLLYNKEGELEGLPEDELLEVFEANTKMSVDSSDKDVLEAIEQIRSFMLSIKPMIKRPHTTDWDVLMAMISHGRKYGRIQDGLLRVDITHGVLRRKSRKASKETFYNSLDRLKKMGITSGKDEGDRSGHFLIDIEKITTPSSWSLPQDYVYPYLSKGEGVIDTNKEGINEDPNTLYSPAHYLGTDTHNSEMEDLIDSVSHTSWYRGIGPTKLAYIMAMLSLGGEARTSEIAERMGRKSTSISGILSQLVEVGIFQRVGRGLYRINLDELPEQVFKYRVKKQEFLRDEKFKFDAQKAKEKSLYYSRTYVHNDGKKRKKAQDRFQKMIEVSRGSRALASDRAEEITSGGHHDG